MYFNIYFRGGKFVAAATGQILVFYEVMDYKQLNYLTLGAQILAFVWAFFIPPVKKSLYFNKVEDEAQTSQNDQMTEKIIQKKDRNPGQITKAFVLLWIHARAAYTQKEVIQCKFFN